MAYFWSIPPILIPAAQFTLSILGDNTPTNLLQIVVAMGWALFATSVLLWGAKMTARVTQMFLVIEVVSVLVMGIWGYSVWGHVIHGGTIFAIGHIRWPGVIVCMVIAATIVDGWEIDSYAAEESQKPLIAPGWGGIIGALGVAVYYLTIWPILLHEVPLHTLETSPDVLTIWSKTVAPGFLPWIRIAILASTAGSLWLTSYILSRALFAMSRDGVLPFWLGRLNRHKAPMWAIVIPVGSSAAVIVLQLMFPSMNALFTLVLSAAGFFLVAEFLLDGINMAVFLLRHHATLRHDLKTHHHAVLFLGSLFVVLTLGLLEGLFLVYGPRYIGPDIDWVTVVMIGVGLLHVLWIKAVRRQQTIVFNPDAGDLFAAGPVAWRLSQDK